jgi:murein DD-endopeptidase MepM/ murein hydrolase activator NlpD
MTPWIRKFEFAIVLTAPLLLAACASGPRTELDWKVNDRYHATRVAKAEYHAPRQDYYAQSATPKPHPRPAWYADNDTVRPQPAVQVQPLQPVQYEPGQMQFAWPISGRVISDFGASQSGERNDGINIAATFGEPIRAAASGSVSYAGNELKGYGNLVLIRHDDGYVTAYAHAQSILVSRGDSVTKGQIIGYAGDTGDVSSPQLHFEIRRGVQPVNPRPLLMAART